MISVSVISFAKQYTHMSFGVIMCFCIVYRQRKYGSSTVQRNYTRISRLSCLIYSLGKLKIYGQHIHNMHLFDCEYCPCNTYTTGTFYSREKYSHRQTIAKNQKYSVVIISSPYTNDHMSLVSVFSHHL